MYKNIVLCGVGRQGTVLASKLLAAAAMEQEIPVMSAETIGMAQRGGSVFSHVRIGDGLYSPMIETGTADLIIGFELGETVRMLPYLSIYVETNGTVDFLDLADRISARVKSKIGVTPLVKVVEIGLLPRSEKKTKRVIDERYE